MYIVAVVVCVTIDGGSIANVIPQIFLVGADFFDIPEVLHGPDWTLRIEVLFYIIVSIFIATKSTRSPVVMYIVYLVITLALGLSSIPIPLTNMKAYVTMYAPFLFMGSLIYLYERGKVRLSALLSFCVLIFVLYWVNTSRFEPKWLEANFAIIGVLLFFLCWRFRDSFPKSALIRELSNITYSFYLLHIWAFKPINTHIVAAGVGNYAAARVLSTVVLACICFVLYYMVERPANGLARRLTKSSVFNAAGSGGGGRFPFHLMSPQNWRWRCLAEMRPWAVSARKSEDAADEVGPERGGKGPRRTKLALLAILIVIAVWEAIALLGRISLPSATYIKVDMEVSGGQNLEVFLNDLTREPYRVPLQPGQRHSYILGPVWDSSITLLRVDPTDVSNADIAIHGVALYNERGVFAAFDSQALSHFKFHCMDNTRDEREALRAVSSTDDPFLYIAPNINISSNILGGRFRQWKSLATSPTNLVWISVIAGCLIIVLTGLEAGLAYPFLVVCGGLAVWGLPLLSSILETPASTTGAVGYDVFHGWPINGPGRALMLLVFGMLLLGGWLGLKRMPVPQVPACSRGFTGSAWQGVLGCMLLAFTFIPSWPWAVGQAVSQKYSRGWDAENILSWAVQLHQGRLPFKDFFYSYSGIATYMLPLPWGQWAWLMGIAIPQLALFLSLRRLFGGNAVAAILISLSLNSLNGVFFGIDRYILGVAVALAYVADTMPRPDQRQSNPVIFWVVTSVALFLEPVQVAYAGLPVAICLASDLWQARPLSPRIVFDRLFRDFGVLIAVLLGLIMLAAALGMLQGVIDFYGNFKSMIVFATSGRGHLRNTANLINLVFPVAMAGLGGFDMMRAETRTRGKVFMSLALVGALIMQKSLMRDITQEYILIPFLCGVFVVMLVSLRRPGLKIAVVGVAGGLACALLGVHGAFGTKWNQIVDGPHRLVELVGATISDDAERERANSVRYDLSHFTEFTEDMALAVDLKAHGAGQGGALVHMVTDHPMLYVFLGQPIPYQINLYNTSPLSEQRRMAEWEYNAKPAWAVWDRTQTLVDNVPLASRVPVLVDSVVENFVFDHRVGTFDVLRRRQDGDPMDWALWSERLGTRLNMGHAVELGGASRLGACKEGQACRAVLEVGVDAPGGQVVIPVRIGEREFEIAFDTVSGRARYVVPLDLVWFWQMAERFGVRIEVARERLPPGTEVIQSKRSAEPDILY